MILIASSALDEPTWAPVKERLESRGRRVVVYEADKVAAGKELFNLTVDAHGGITFEYGGTEVDLTRITAAWFRRPSLFSLESEDVGLQYCLDTERRKGQYLLWELVPPTSWLSQPRAITHAEHKLIQLRIAVQAGFSIPQTAVTNYWGSLRSTLATNDVIFKPSYGMLYSADELRILYTTVVDLDQLGDLGTACPFPGFWQPRLEKAREWRVTVVGDRTFDTVVVTAPGARDDWRRHQLNSELVRFELGELPADYKAMCFEYLTRLELGFGAFDLIEMPDGEIVFLECNANGQYGWLEHVVGHRISDAIADWLADRDMEMSS